MRGIPEKEMHFCGEPTADFDAAGMYLRAYYEANRETWWDRNRHSRNQARLRAGVADNFMLGLLNEVHRIGTERIRQVSK